MKQINSYIIEKLKITKDSKTSGLKKFDGSIINYNTSVNYSKSLCKFYYINKQNSRYKYGVLMSLKYIDKNGNIYNEFPEGKDKKDVYYYPNEKTEETFKLTSHTTQSYNRYTRLKTTFLDENLFTTMPWHGKPVKFSGVNTLEEISDEELNKLNLDI